MNTLKKLIVLTAFLAVLVPLKQSFASDQVSDYLCDLGVSFYDSGKYDDAKYEFEQSLIADPNNEKAKKYLNLIENKGKNIKQEPLIEKQAPTAPVESAPAKAVSDTDKSVSVALDRTPAGSSNATEGAGQGYSTSGVSVTGGTGGTGIGTGEAGQGEIGEGQGPAGKAKKPKIKISGETQVSFGVRNGGNDFIWNEANADLNERNWRILSGDALNRHENTYDTRVFDRFKLDVDTTNKEGFGFHTDITVDPWSFTGKTDKVNVSEASGDSAEVQYLYWGNSVYTLNTRVNSLYKGDAFSLPEVKIVDGKVPATSVKGLLYNSSYPAGYFVYNIPQMKASEYNFQPIRELWFDYKKENLNLRVFPIAYQDQAMTSDDPLHLSNNHIWWEESPWLDAWQPGNYNSKATDVWGFLRPDFTKGKWDDSLSFYARDSYGVRLTALRGLSFALKSDEDISFATTIASPKSPWQDYGKFDNLESASRLKQKFGDNLSLGATYTLRMGFDLTDGYKKDAENHVIGADIDYGILEGIKASGEASHSINRQDLTNATYRSKNQGNAYYFSLVSSFPKRDIMSLQYGYDELKPDKDDKDFVKARFFGARMDNGFSSALSTYRETRDDAFWSRHIQFKQPFDYYFSGLYDSNLKWEDIEPFRIGNGIDIGRNVLGFRLENYHFNSKLINLFDIRNVHGTDGTFIENVVRDEATLKLTNRLTAKALGIYQKMPKTEAGIDPFMTDSDTGVFLKNTAITGGDDPTLKTGSLGMEYKFFDGLKLNSVYERTNDSTLAYDNFPRGILNSIYLGTDTQYGNIYRQDVPFVYSQGLFPLPPYSFYNIYRLGLDIRPTKKTGIYLDYTRNDFKSAGQIDNNINHFGVELSYLATEKLGFYVRYVYSRWNDV